MTELRHRRCDHRAVSALTVTEQLLPSNVLPSIAAQVNYLQTCCYTKFPPASALSQ